MANLQIIKDENNPNFIWIGVDLSQTGQTSRSGKSTIIATTGGAAEISEAPGVKFNINIYKLKG